LFDLIHCSAYYTAQKAIFISKNRDLIFVFLLLRQTTKNNEVILAKQFRPGPNEVLLELPGRGIYKEETPEQAIERELLEEAGYKGKAKLIAGGI